MPTYAATQRFQKDYAALSEHEKDRFERVIRERFVEDLARGRFRKGLRVKTVEGTSGIWEMTWADDGRATFEFGEEVRPGEPHVIWRRIGSHAIFSRP